jgi:hypothetical protein
MKLFDCAGLVQVNITERFLTERNQLSGYKSLLGIQKDRASGLIFPGI